MTPTKFSPALLQSYSSLQNYLVGHDKDQRVAQQVLEASRVNWSKWHWVQWLTEPFAPIYSLFLSAVGGLLYYTGFVRKGLQLDLQSEVYSHSQIATGFSSYGKDFGNPATNCYSAEAIDIYEQPALPVENIACKKVRDTIRRNVVALNKNGGCCHGASLWMIRAYLKTQSLFTQHRKHLQALGSLFTRGAPSEAVLIQQLCPKPELLKMRLIPKGAFSKQENLEKTYASMMKFFKKLKPGAYQLNVPLHALTYISPKKGEGYLFDPNIGTMAINNDKSFGQLVRLIYEYYQENNNELKQTLEKRLDCKDFDWNIIVHFNQYELTDS